MTQNIRSRKHPRSQQVQCTLACAFFDLAAFKHRCCSIQLSWYLNSSTSWIGVDGLALTKKKQIKVVKW